MKIGLFATHLLGPTWSLSSCDENLPQVRVLVDASTPVEIILDSGADVSAFPRSCGNVGVEVGQHEAQFSDVQGSPLHIHSTRVAKVTFGDVTLKERFIVTDVSIPILALGHLVRAGWSLQSNDQEQYLMKGHKSFKVGFKRSSLCTAGSINMISNNGGELFDVRKSTSYNVSDARNDGADNHHDEAGTTGASFVAFKEATLDKEEIPGKHVSKSTQVVGDLNQELSINAITLQPVLEHLRPGWNKISPHSFAITTTVPEYVDTTLCPSDELMWLRTTLVTSRDGWRLFEFCKQIGIYKPILRSCVLVQTFKESWH